jgi:hypothetical protein
MGQCSAVDAAQKKSLTSALACHVLVPRYRGSESAHETVASVTLKFRITGSWPKWLKLHSTQYASHTRRRIGRSNSSKNKQDRGTSGAGADGRCNTWAPLARHFHVFG